MVTAIPAHPDAHVSAGTLRNADFVLHIVYFNVLPAVQRELRSVAYAGGLTGVGRVDLMGASSKSEAFSTS